MRFGVGRRQLRRGASTPKVKPDRFIVLDTEECCFVDDNSELGTDTCGVVFTGEKTAVEVAEEWLNGVEDADEKTKCIIYKLVPVAVVKRAKAVVERV